MPSSSTASSASRTNIAVRSAAVCRAIVRMSSSRSTRSSRTALMSRIAASPRLTMAIRRSPRPITADGMPGSEPGVAPRGDGAGEQRAGPLGGAGDVLVEPPGARAARRGATPPSARRAERLDRQRQLGRLGRRRRTSPRPARRRGRSGPPARPCGVDDLERRPAPSRRTARVVSSRATSSGRTQMKSKRARSAWRGGRSSSSHGSTSSVGRSPRLDGGDEVELGEEAPQPRLGRRRRGGQLGRARRRTAAACRSTSCRRCSGA